MKRALDIFFAGVLIILLFPLFIVLSVLISITSPGPVIFVQRRIGLKGRVFNIYKFRTMCINAEIEGTGLYSYQNDARITNLGHFLRRFSIDELPQLFNILYGSMSFVGPRPPVTYELGPWNEFTQEMLKRFEVKPGITGLAQVSGRNDLDWDSKVYLDNLYVDRLKAFGVKEDFRIVLKTIQTVVRSSDTIEKESVSPASEGPIAAKARIACEKYLSQQTHLDEA